MQKKDSLIHIVWMKTFAQFFNNDMLAVPNKLNNNKKKQFINI